MNMLVSTDDDYMDYQGDKEGNITKIHITTINGIRAITFNVLLLSLLSPVTLVSWLLLISLVALVSLLSLVTDNSDTNDSPDSRDTCATIAMKTIFTHICVFIFAVAKGGSL